MANKQDFTRREVVQMAGAVSAAAAASRLQGAPAIQKVRGANNQVQYGFIGTGSRGQYLLKHLKAMEGGRCVALCDIDESAMRKAAELVPQKPAMHKDHRDLLARKDVDAVLIATPLFAHFPVTKDALDAGKHVFCEKSLVFKPEEVHALRALANSKPKQILQTGLQRRYSKYYQMVKQMIDKGVLGTVTHVHAQWHRNPGWTMKPGGEMKNWRLFKKYSGGLTAELASHQIDVADWMFGSHPEYVLGVGELLNWKDGRDIFDEIQLIYRYPKGQKLVYSAITTSQHLPLFNASRTEFGELIMGTGGAVHITVGTDNEPATAIWYPEKDTKLTKADPKTKENTVAGATMVTGKASQGLPVLLEGEAVDMKNDSFIQREMKFARLWLYKKGILVPEEPVNPVDTELEGFFHSVRTGTRPRADLEVGLMDSTTVMLSNLAMEEQRKVYFSEINNMGTGAPTQIPPSPVPARPAIKSGNGQPGANRA
jgi:predicted dehydrogenase